jgi:hypothetical protein
MKEAATATMWRDRAVTLFGVNTTVAIMCRDFHRTAGENESGE